MWTILKYKKKELRFLKAELSSKLTSEPKFYIPKIKYEFFKKNKLFNKESLLLGDYLLCFHKDFANEKLVRSLKNCKGLNYFLEGFINSQKEINEFVKRCIQYEDDQGYIKQSFFNFSFSYNRKYKFLSGPFTNMIFNIIDLQHNKIKVLIGNLKTTVSSKEYLFVPV